MHPLLHFFGWEIPAYNLFLGLAILITISSGHYLLRKSDVSNRHIGLLALATTIAGLFGARLLHGMTNWPLYRADPSLWLRFSASGFAIYGGALAAAITGFLVSRRFELNPWLVGDKLAPGLGLGIATVRIGCFLNGCCFGHVTDSPLGVRFPMLSQAHRWQMHEGLTGFWNPLLVHPTELYELTAALLGSMVAWIILKRKAPPGLAILSFGLTYTCFRLINLQWRVPSPSFSASPWLYPAIYSTMIIIEIALIARLLRQRKNTRTQEQ